jgi:hypothetical protein
MSPAYPAGAVEGYTNPNGFSLPGYAPSAGSQYFTPVELISGTVGSPVKMPYVPNSMVLDRTGTTLYFGSSHELMVYTAASNSLSKEDPNVPGVVLAAAPDNSRILINNPLRQLFYLYTTSSGSFSSYSGVGTAAQFTPDGKTLYVTGTSFPTDAGGTATPTPTLFVYNVNTGWTTYPLGNAAPDLAITVPGVGAFLSGTTTVAHGWCPTLNAATGYIAQAYPQMASVPRETEILGATIDGAHVIGVGLGTGTPELTDINLSFAESLTNGACPAVASGGVYTSTNITTSPVTADPQTAIVPPAGTTIAAFNQVLPSPASNVAFITYSAGPGSTGTATLPYYTPATGAAAGPVDYVTLTGAPTAPVAGAFSLDDTLFFLSTSGDDAVHYINLTKTPFTDAQQIKPGLLDINGNPLPATVVVVKPRSTT